MFLKSFSETITNIVAGLRAADAEEREAESARIHDPSAARARGKKRQLQSELRTAFVRGREVAVAAKRDVVARLSDDRAVVADQLADALTQVGTLRDRLALTDRKITAARADCDRIALSPSRHVTIRLDRGIDRTVPPQDILALDGPIWTGIAVEAATKGVNGAWAVDFTFNEITGQLIGPAKFHYEKSPDERRAHQDAVAREIAERRAGLRHADPSGQAEREAANQALREARR